MGLLTKKRLVLAEKEKLQWLLWYKRGRLCPHMIKVAHSRPYIFLKCDFVIYLIMSRIPDPPNLICWSPTLTNGTIFGDRRFKKVTEAEWGLNREALSSKHWDCGLHVTWTFSRIAHYFLLVQVWESMVELPGKGTWLVELGHWLWTCEGYNQPHF